MEALGPLVCPNLVGRDDLLALADGRCARAEGLVPVTSAWDAESGGVRWHLELERDQLLPGRLVGGRVRIMSEGEVEARRLLVELRGEERWEYETTSTDSDGHTTTQRHTGSASQPAVPVQVLGPVQAGGRRDGRGAVRAPGAVARPAHRARDDGQGRLDRRREARHRGRAGHLDRGPRPGPPAGRPPPRRRGARWPVRPLSIGRRNGRAGRHDRPRPGPVVRRGAVHRDGHAPAVEGHRRPLHPCRAARPSSRRP